MKRLLALVCPDRALRWHTIAPDRATWTACRCFNVPPWMVVGG